MVLMNQIVARINWRSTRCQFLSKPVPGSRRHEPVVVGGREEAGEGADGLAVLGEEEVVAPSGERAVLGGVVAGEGLLVALEHLRDLHHVRDVDVGQHVHQLLQVPDALVTELCILG